MTRFLLLLACCVALSRASCPYMGAPEHEASSGCPFAGLKAPSASAVNMTHVALAPDAGQMTVKGCECATSCGASIDDGFKCDWCYTKDKCGTLHHSQSYDYCVYPDNKTFAALSYQEKDSYFWSRLTADKTRAAAYPSQVIAVTEDVQTSFWDFKDEMPAGRVKAIHGIGAVCKFRLDIASDSPYTGLFSSGPQDGFIRMGGATTWDKKGKGYPPGLGIKFSRSGVQSGSFVALVSLDAAGFNFMGKNFSNHIAPPASVATKVLVKKFEQASQCPSQVGLSDMATWTQDGKKVHKPKVPFKLFMVPSAEVQRPDTPKDIDEVMGELESFKKGTNLMTVYACAKGNGKAEIDPTAGGLEKACGSPFKLGEMVTTSECTTSAYGDAKFFIRHQPIEEDWMLNPEFLKQYDAKAACAWHTKPTAKGIPKQCGAK